MPPCQTPADELLRFNRSRRANTSNLNLDTEDGTVVILGYDQHYTLSWDQIGTPTGYQDLVELREAVVEELRRDNVECAIFTAEDIVLTLHDPDISLESDAPLYGDEGREVRDKIKLSGEIAILPAGIQRGIDGSMVLTRPSHFRNNDALPDKPNYHRQPVEMLSRTGQVSSGSIFDVKDSVQMVLSTDTKAASYEVERCFYTVPAGDLRGHETGWEAVKKSRVRVDVMGEMTNLTVSKLKCRYEQREADNRQKLYKFRVRGIGKGPRRRVSAWAHARGLARPAGRSGVVSKPPYPTPPSRCAAPSRAAAKLEALAKPTAAPTMVSAAMASAGGAQPVAAPQDTSLTMLSPPAAEAEAEPATPATPAAPAAAWAASPAGSLTSWQEKLKVIRRELEIDPSLPLLSAMRQANVIMYGVELAPGVAEDMKAQVTNMHDVELSPAVQ